MTVMNLWPEDEERFGKNVPLFEVSDIELDEVSVVHAGDNPGAHIMLIKSRKAAKIAKQSEAWQREYHEREELRKATPHLPPAELVRSELAEAEATVRAHDPSLTPAEAWQKVMQTDEASRVRAAYAKAHAAHVEAQQLELLGDRAIEAQRVNHRADAIRREAGMMGEKITPAEAYRRAMNG